LGIAAVAFEGGLDARCGSFVPVQIDSVTAAGVERTVELGTVDAGGNIYAVILPRVSVGRRPEA
jgi:hypothetical protein